MTCLLILLNDPPYGCSPQKVHAAPQAAVVSGTLGRAILCLLVDWKSRPVGRPHLPKDIQALILQMATENPTWAQEHRQTLDAARNGAALNAGRPKTCPPNLATASQFGSR